MLEQTSTRTEMHFLQTLERIETGGTAILRLFPTINKAIMKPKRKIFRKFCNNMESIPAAARLYKTIAKIEVKGPMAFQREDGSYIEDKMMHGSPLQL